MPKEHSRTRPLLLGALADDRMGATGLAATLSRNGMDVVQILGLPSESEETPEADAVVCALETRHASVEQAVAESVAAARWLLARGARQLFFGYGSTFDSTETGNIGPVAEALLDLVEETLTVVCPACPEDGRTVYQGHLFVHDRPLSESAMRHHRMTPMTDADLVRLLGKQCRRTDAVGLVAFDVVDRGAGPIRGALAHLQGQGTRFAVLDALKEDHLWSAATAVAERRLVTGGSGIARGLPANFRRTDALPQRVETRLPALGGPVVILAGSCSEATRAQVGTVAGQHPTLALDPTALATERAPLDKLLAEARTALGGGVLMVHSTASPEEVETAREALGPEQATAVLEQAFGAVAASLVAAGARSLVVAGTDTSRCVAQALGLRCLRIGPEIEPGLPWTLHLGEPAVHLAFKPGDFGSDTFFLEALKLLEQG